MPAGVQESHCLGRVSDAGRSENQKMSREIMSSRVVDILAVGQSEARCETLERALTALGHRVACANSTEQALKMFYRTAFNLVLCDRGPNELACDEFAAYLRTLVPRQRVLLLDFAATLGPNQFMPDGPANEVAK
jgi:PleD family two-component response regulator